MTILTGALPPQALGKTPADYLEPSFPLPSSGDSSPRIVGLLACQCDPLATELETSVVACDPAKVAVTTNGTADGGKKKKAANGPKPEELFEVELVDTVLFPEGGGQPSDLGTLTMTGSSIPIPVRSVFRRGLTAVHVVPSPIPVGSQVRATLDARLRLDHMTQHTAQHLISAVLESPAFDIPTVSWGFSPAPSPCYVELPRAPTADERLAVEARCNDLIRSNLRVRVRIDRLAESEGLEKRADYVGGVKRTVTIDGVDSNPCCGTHVPSLSMIQSVHILPTTTTIRGSNVRLYFLAGPRVLEGLAASLERIRLIGAEVSGGAEEVVEKVRGLAAQSREARSRERRLREEVAGFLADAVVSRVKASSHHDGVKAATLVRDDDSTNDLDFLNLVSFKVKEVLSPSAEPWVVLLACCSAATPQGGGALVVFGSEDAAPAVEAVGKRVREGLGGKIKGGGKGRFQGKLVPGQTWTTEDRRLLDEATQGLQR